MNKNLPIIAVFDFDKTLTYHDTFIPFIIFVCGYKKFVKVILSHLFDLVSFLFRIETRDNFKEKMLTAFFGGMSIESLRKSGELYAKTIPRRLRPEGIKRLCWHKDQGHRCLLVSASLDVYLEPWAKSAGFEYVLCTRLEIDALTRVTGRMVGGNCWGPIKLQRLQQYLGSLDQYILYVYGDSRGDQEMLAVATYPFFKRLGPYTSK